MGAIPTPMGQAKPMAAFYDFVRSHLAIVNNVLAASATLVGLLDFFAPRLSVLPKIVYGCTGTALALMLAAALAPAAMARLFGAVGVSLARAESGPLWRRPAWQFAVAILLAVTSLGFISVAKAAQGGIIAGSAPDARRWQQSILALQADSGEIKSGVAAANAKLDRIADAVDPDNPADRCPDIACAVQGGASAAAVKKLLGKGARVEGGLADRGELAKEIAESGHADRLEILDMLIGHGLDPSATIFAYAAAESALSAESIRVAREAKLASGIGERFGSPMPGLADAPDLNAWNQINGCLLRTSKGTSLMELAAIRGDAELYRHLKARGVALPDRPLVCKWAAQGQSGAARIDIKDGVATVAPLRL